MRAVLVVFCASIAFVSGQTTQVSQCLLTPGGLPLNVHVHGCSTPPCLLPQLQNVVIDVIFAAPHTARNMTTLATALVTFITELEVPYNLGPNAHTCNFFTNTYCPILRGEVVQYRLKMFIERFFPVGTLATVEFRIVDNDRGKEDIWCLRVPIRIMPAIRAVAIGSE